MWTSAALAAPIVVDNFTVQGDWGAGNTVTNVSGGEYGSLGNRATDSSINALPGSMNTRYGDYYANVENYGTGGVATATTSANITGGTASFSGSADWIGSAEGDRATGGTSFYLYYTAPVDSDAGTYTSMMDLGEFTGARLAGSGGMTGYSSAVVQLYMRTSPDAQNARTWTINLGATTGDINFDLTTGYTDLGTFDPTHVGEYGLWFDYSGGVTDIGTGSASFDYNASLFEFTVPEPASLSLLGLGAVALMSRRRRA